MRWLPLLLLVGCVDAGVLPGPSEGADETPVVPLEWTASFDWQPCPVVTGGQGADAACATVELPLHWAAPDEPIEVFVKRVGPADGSSAVWMLAGGPGGAGSLYEGWSSTCRTTAGSVARRR